MPFNPQLPVNTANPHPGKSLEGSTKWFSVLSSNVSAIRRVGNSLHVLFHSGAVYTYIEAGERLQEMLAAGSKGKFVYYVLRRQYAYSRL